MDPNACLREIRLISSKIIETVTWTDEEVQELAETFSALNDWISRGGFLPKDWEGKE